MEKIWVVQDKKYDDIITQLLYNRGVDVSDRSDIKQYLSPEFSKSMPDPFLLPDMDKAVNRIIEAKNANQIVGIFADYDADGIPGAAFLAKTLSQLGIQHQVYIPSREEGYGLSEVGINYLIEKKVELIITVDLGIRNQKEALYCAEQSIDLIVTDHHVPGDDLPSCVAVVDPKIVGSKYPFCELSGAAVAYKLAYALSTHFPKELNESFLKWNLDLIAISTISDVVPLIRDNRTICYFGLNVLQKSKNVGIRSLIEIAKIDQKNMKAYHVGFQIGPRINAPGRMDHATKSYQILVTEDEKEAKELAEWLESKNIERQEAMDKVEREASNEILKRELFRDNIIIVKGKKWPKGVIGPTASRLSDKFNRPIIILSQSENVLTGSARSLPGVDIVKILEQAKEFVIKYGGHAGAAGLTLLEEQFEGFRLAINQASKSISVEDLLQKVKIDLAVKFNDIDLKIIDELDKFEPFGMGNPKPIFASYDLSIVSSRFVGKDEKHISLFLSDGSRELKAIYFNCEDKDYFNKIKGKKVKVAYNLVKDEWNGNAKPSLNIIDIKLDNA